MQAEPDARPRASGTRQALTWLGSLAAGALLLWLASFRLQLWPDELVLPHPELFVVAVLAVVPYAMVRAFRLGYVFDPLVASASGQAVPRLSRPLLYGSGFVSFFVILALPFYVGELSRPLILARARQPGLRFTEAVAGVGMERVVDGLLISALLFGGLAFAGAPAERAADLQYVHGFGRIMLGLFVITLLGLVLAARDPDATGRATGRITGWFARGLSERMTDVARRLAGTLRAVSSLDRGMPVVLWSLVYWAITVLQLWLVLLACGLELGLAEASAVVAIIGLSIQLPSGPAKAGSFQVGAGLGLSLFVAEGALAGAGSTFAALMYVLQLGGAAVMAVPGLALLALQRRGRAQETGGERGAAP